jgi:hypothetical protein
VWKVEHLNVKKIKIALENGTARIIYGIETLITRGAFPVHPA